VLLISPEKSLIMLYMFSISNHLFFVPQHRIKTQAIAWLPLVFSEVLEYINAKYLLPDRQGKFTLVCLNRNRQVHWPPSQDEVTIPNRNRELHST
jgi:hypothetical protein